MRPYSHPQVLPGLFSRLPIRSPGFELTERDIEILRLVHEYRLLLFDHLQALTGRSYKALHRRISKLVENKYIQKIDRSHFQKQIFAIGNGAIPILIERGYAPMALSDYRARANELKDLFLQHELMIVDIHASLALASQPSSFKLVQWQEGVDLHDTVTFTEQGKEHRLPVRPDAFFTLEDQRRPAGQNRIHYFLEADRSTTDHHRFKKKMKAYHQYHRQDLHTKKHGIKGFRVVTVTLTRERALNLCQATADIIGPGKHYLFAPIGNVSLSQPDPIFGNIFITPKDYEDYYAQARKKPYQGKRHFITDALNAMLKQPAESWHPLFPPLRQPLTQNA